MIRPGFPRSPYADEIPDAGQRDDLPERLEQLAAYRHEHLIGDEKGEAQVFLDRLFIAFGHQGVREAGATLESRLRTGPQRHASFADLMWKPRCLIEMKKASVDLRLHYDQAFNYWVHAVTSALVRPGAPLLVSNEAAAKATRPRTPTQLSSTSGRATRRPALCWRPARLTACAGVLFRPRGSTARARSRFPRVTLKLSPTIGLPRFTFYTTDMKLTQALRA